MRTKLPVLPELCLVNNKKAIKGAEARKVAHQKLCEKQGSKELKALVPSQCVLVQQLRGLAKRPRWDNSGAIVSQNEDRQSYYVDLDSSEQLLRNRVYLRELTEKDDTLNENIIHESIAKLPRQSKRLAEKSGSSL